MVAPDTKKGRGGGFPLLPLTSFPVLGPRSGLPPRGDQPVSDQSLFCCLGRRHNALDVDKLAALAAVAKRDSAVTEREKGMVFAQADVGPRVPARAALTHDDVAAA